MYRAESSIGFIKSKKKKDIVREKVRQTDKGGDRYRLKQSKRKQKGKRKREGDRVFSLGSVQQVLSNKHR